MEVLTRLDPERVAQLRGRGEFFWLDLVAPDKQELLALGRAIDLHPMALEDTYEFGQRPKLDDYDDQALLVFYSARPRSEPGRPRTVDPVEVHIYVSGDYVVTVRRDAGPPLDDLRGELAAADPTAETYVVYRILDALTDAYLPVLETIDGLVDELEEAILRRARGDQLERIYRLRQDVHELQRRVGPQHDQFPRAAEAIVALPGLAHGRHEYLRDVGDHLNQVAGELWRLNQDLASLTDTFYNANANRLNATATRLTLIATLFLVWTLITGFFGQNFRWLVDHVESRTDFLMFGAGSLVVSSLVLLVLFWWRRDDWF